MFSLILHLTSCTFTMRIHGVNKQRATSLPLSVEAVCSRQAGTCLLASSPPFMAQHSSRTSSNSLSFCCAVSPLCICLCLQVSDKGGGVPFRRIENLFSYMYSTAPAPQIGEHTRPPLVSRDIQAVGCFRLLTGFHAYIYRLLKNKYIYFLQGVNCTICRVVAFLCSPQALKCSFSLSFILLPLSRS